MKHNVFLIVLLIVAAAVCAIQDDRLCEENRRLRQELAHARIPLEPTVIHDSIPVVTQTVVEVDRKDLTDALEAERQMVKDLQLKVKQLEAVQTTTVETGDTVPAEYQARDSMFIYHDQWADLRLNLRDTVFYYNIRDSLATVVYREYRHRFLWWRWGTKGYKVKIVNFNPHARVTYNRYIRSGK